MTEQVQVDPQVSVGRLRWRDGKEGARVLMGTVRPDVGGSEGWRAGVETMTHLAMAHAPVGCFIKVVRVSCDSLRDGKPRGRRLHFVIVYAESAQIVEVA